MKLLRRKKKEPEWRKLLGAAALGGAAALIISRNFFDMEKKIRCPIQADYDAGDDEFVRTMGQLMGPPLLEGNKVTTLQNGDEIFPAMLAGIRSARRTITFEIFWYQSEISREFAETLAERARAGIKVHFLQDVLGCNNVRGRDMDLLRRSPVELEIFRFVQGGGINHRTHRKLLIIDGKLGFIGGVGISDYWGGDGKTQGFWRDTHYEVEGPVVGQMQQAFMDNWMQTRAVVLHGDAYFPKLKEAGQERSQCFKSSANEGADSARVMLLLSIAAARKNIRIANAYFIPDDLCRRTLIEACQRGVEVEIITPGPDIDARVVRWVGKTRWRPLLEAGARFYEYMPARYHCKYIIVDDCWASVGSANFDNRSLRLNEEANLNVLDKKFCMKHIRIFEEDRSRSREVTLEDWEKRAWREKFYGNIAAVFRSQM